MRRMPCFAASWPQMNVAQCLVVAAVVVVAAMRMTYMRLVSFLMSSPREGRERERESRHHKLGMRVTHSEREIDRERTRGREKMQLKDLNSPPSVTSICCCPCPSSCMLTLWQALALLATNPAAWEALIFFDFSLLVPFGLRLRFY